MSERLNYRVWDKKNKKYVTSFPGSRIDLILTYYETHTHMEYPEQYTGKNDLQNNPLYENDILQSFHFEERKLKHYLYHQIVWSDKYDGWFAKSVNAKTLEENGSIQLFVYLRTAIDVVLYSNIHEFTK